MKVFWSWQSDTPGKVGRHFIREALDRAISDIQKEQIVLEPASRQLHLDHDRKGVPGSPDLAATIFSKIDQSSVFFADVTLVGNVRTEMSDPTKKVVNSNVAIELGYALKSIGDSAVLMVSNRYFGRQHELPFDLRHKAGPIEFELSPDATKDEIAAELRQLTGLIKVALRPYLERTRPEKAPQVPTHPKSGTYFDPFEVLGRIGEEQDGDLLNLHHGGDRYFSLRMIPNVALEEPVAKHALIKMVRQLPLSPFGRERGGFWQANKYGAIALEPKNNNNDRLDASTQAFANGELWGISEYLLVDNERGRFIPTGAVEESLAFTINNYLEFAGQALGLTPPYDFEFSAKGISAFGLVVKDFMGHRRAPLHDDSFLLRLTLTQPSNEGIKKLVDACMAKLYDAAGLPPPS